MEMKKYKLGEIINFYNGKQRPKSNGCYPVYGGNGIIGYSDEYNYEDNIIIGRVGANCGSIQKCSDKCWVSDNAISVTVKENFDKEYIYNLLKSMNLNVKHVGAAQPLITQGILSELIAYIPSLVEQKKISSILSSLDDKIALNNRINAKLEQMAKRLYDYWFVQFDFPGADGKPYKSNGGKMVWNKELKRDIPEGWEVKKLEDIVETIIDHRGLTPKKLGGDWVADGIIALSAKIVKGNKLIHLDESNKVSEEMYHKWMPEELKEGDILMTSEAPLGEFYFLVGNTKYCLSQRLFAIRADKRNVLASYLFYELSEGHGYSQIMGSQSGSTVFGIRQEKLRKISIVIPSFVIQQKFHSIELDIYKEIRNRQEENQKLISIRDKLLPLLMNGQVVVE